MAERMKGAGVKVLAYYNELLLRERMLLMFAVLTVTWVGWNATLGGFLEESKIRISRDITSLRSQLQAEVVEQRRLDAARNNDPNKRLVSERRLLDSEFDELNEKLSLVLERFVEPERMPALLEDVIQHHQGLRLKRIVSLPVELVRLSNSTGEKTAIQIYRHPLELRFEGNYFEMMAYLEELEASQWEFGWRRLEYRVAEYPTAVVVIEIETLSREESWIGV
ncbi:MAG: hypothetical protein O7F71_19095 [Gammaproteobacteria bacterium]|nr:hypothetical protein [Gammaproteobacteria bacterium]